MNPEKKLKLILASLKDQQIVKFFQAFSLNFQDQFKKSIRQISYNCYESVCEFKNKLVSGYGKNLQQSYVNSVRTLVQMLADDNNYYKIMKQCLKIVQQSAPNINQSHKKLSINEKQSTNNLKNIALNYNNKPIQKKSTLKQQIFEYLNLDNLKISNPNTNYKANYTHNSFINKPNNQEQKAILDQILTKNNELQQKINQAKDQNLKLKLQFRQQSQKQFQQTNLKQNENIKKLKQKNTTENIKPRQTYDPLKTRTNDYLNISQDTKVLDKSKLRSVSVEASQTQKYMMPKPVLDKKITVPKLNLQILPNYHGKSNKSLNQSLMQVYQKSHCK